MYEVKKLEVLNNISSLFFNSLFQIPSTSKYLSNIHVPGYNLIGIQTRQKTVACLSLPDRDPTKVQIGSFNPPSADSVRARTKWPLTPSIQARPNVEYFSILISLKAFWGNLECLSLFLFLFILSVSEKTNIWHPVNTTDS